MVWACLIAPLGCVFSWAVGWRLWECLCSRNPGWCCLYCSISACVPNQCQQSSTVFCFHTHAHTHTQSEISHSLITVSILTPTRNPPSALSLFVSIADCPFHEMWVGAQMNCHTEILVNPADILSVITDGIHAGRWVLVCRHAVCWRIAVCLCSLSFWPACYVQPSPWHFSKHKHNTYTSCCLCVCVWCERVCALQSYWVLSVLVGTSVPPYNLC